MFNLEKKMRSVFGIFITLIILTTIPFNTCYAETLLTVIDMQPSFKTSQDDSLIENTRTAIRKAIEKHQPILFVETEEILTFEMFGTSTTQNIHTDRTDPRLTDLVRDYDRVYFIKKKSTSGSAEIKMETKRLGLPITKMKVCGVNTNACILATVQGIIYSMNEVRITLLSDACRASNSVGHQDGLDSMRKMARVKIK